MRFKLKMKIREEKLLSNIKHVTSLQCTIHILDEHTFNVFTIKEMKTLRVH